MALSSVKRYPEQYMLVVVLIIALGLFAGGTPSSILETRTTQVRITMWQWSTITSAGVTTISVANLVNCGGTRETLQAASAFAIISIILCVFAIAFLVLEMIGRPVHVHATIIAASVLWLPALLTWVLDVSLFSLPLCGTGLVPRDNEFRLGGGLAALVTAWVILTIAVPIYGVVKYYFRKRWDRQAQRRASSVRTVHVQKSGNVEGHSYVVSDDGFEAQDGQGATTVVTSPPKEASRSFVPANPASSIHHTSQVNPPPSSTLPSRPSFFGESVTSMSPQDASRAERVTPASSGVFTSPVHATPQPPAPTRRMSLSMPSDVLY